MTPEIEFRTTPHPPLEECTLLPIDIGQAEEFVLHVPCELTVVAMGTKEQIDNLVKEIATRKRRDYYDLDVAVRKRTILPAKGMAYLHAKNSGEAKLEGPEFVMETLNSYMTPYVVEWIQPERFYEWEPMYNQENEDLYDDLFLPLVSGGVVCGWPSNNSAEFNILTIEEFIANGCSYTSFGLEDEEDYSEEE